MARRFLGRVILLRHGESEYTDVYPDVTHNGIKTIVKSACSIKSLLDDNSSVVIITSPMVRAKGSADIIAKIIGYRGIIKEASSIQGAIARDKKRGKELFDEYIAKGGMRALSIACGIDPRFEDPNIIEPISEIHKRFFEYFAKIVEYLLALVKQQPFLNLICVSHYEVLYHFVENLFELDYTKDEPLGHGEIIVVSVFGLDVESVNVVQIEVTFRKKTIRGKFFDYKEQTIR